MFALAMSLSISFITVTEEATLRCDALPEKKKEKEKKKKNHRNRIMSLSSVAPTI